MQYVTESPMAAGGRGKSWSFCIMILARCDQECIRVLCVREFQNSISDSVYRLLIDQIHAMGLQHRFSWTQTEIKNINGSTISFKGLRDPAGIRSSEKVNLVFVEEASNVSEFSWLTMTPSIRAPGSEIWAVFNPLSEDDATYKRFITNKPANAIVRKINYDQNQYFPEVLRQEMEHMKSIDYATYQHVWEGECRSMTEASVFRDRWQVKEFDDAGVTFFYLGLDFGFAQDPTAIIRCFIRRDENDRECLWIDFEAGGRHIELDDTPQLIDLVPRSSDFVIYADNARPESISFLKRRGYAIKACEKWKGSVEDGLAHMRAFAKIYVHPRCKQTIFEMRNYQYKCDPRTNEVLPILQDKWNHYVDATRYALDRLIPRRGIPSQFAKIGNMAYGLHPL